MNTNPDWIKKMGAKEDNQCVSVGGLVNELAMKCEPIVVDVSLPLCWKMMVETEFDAQERPRDAKNHRSGNADPEAYYDDLREVAVDLPGGTKVIVGLYSGQSNYWGCILIYDKEGNEMYQSDPLETFEDVMECAVAMPIPTSPAHFGLSKYEIKINWE